MASPLKKSARSKPKRQVASDLDENAAVEAEQKRTVSDNVLVDVYERIAAGGSPLAKLAVVSAQDRAELLNGRDLRDIVTTLPFRLIAFRDIAYRTVGPDKTYTLRTINLVRASSAGFVFVTSEGELVHRDELAGLEFVDFIN